MKTIYVNQTEMANVLKLTTRQVRTLGNRGIIVRVGDRYDLIKSVRGYINFLRSRRDGRTLEEVKKIHLEERTKKLKLESEKMLGNLIPRKESEEREHAHVIFATESFRNLGWRLAGPLLSIKDPVEIDFALAIQYGVDEVLRMMAGDEKRKTPVILPGYGYLLQAGLIKPDPDGYVILSKNGKKVKADELLERWGVNKDGRNQGG